MALAPGKDVVQEQKDMYKHLSDKYFWLKHCVVVWNNIWNKCYLWQNGVTALHCAIIHGHAGIVHSLLEAGCSVDETDEVNTFM